MQNHMVSGGAIINTSMILPETMKAKIFSEIGTVPTDLKAQMVDRCSYKIRIN
jgi:hypothetical protein